jgi:hypothetical protein
MHDVRCTVTDIQARSCTGRATLFYRSSLGQATARCHEHEILAVFSGTTLTDITYDEYMVQIVLES